MDTPEFCIVSVEGWPQDKIDLWDKINEEVNALAEERGYPICLITEALPLAVSWCRVLFPNKTDRESVCLVADVMKEFADAIALSDSAEGNA